MILCVNIYINIIIIATINSAGGGVQLKLGKNKKKYCIIVLAIYFSIKIVLKKQSIKRSYYLP